MEKAWQQAVLSGSMIKETVQRCFRVGGNRGAEPFCRAVIIRGFDVIIQILIIQVHCAA